MHPFHSLSIGPALRRNLLQTLCAGALAGPLVPGVRAADAPVITTQPADVTAYVGEDATFNVVATGGVPLAYQWRFGGVNLDGATLPSLVLTNVVAAKAGTYQVVVSNSAGSVTSSPVSLVVSELPTGSLLAGNFQPAPNPRLPVAYSARGNETQVGFSLAFNPATLANPRFVSALPAGNNPGGVGRGAGLADAPPDGATVTADASRASEGLFGVRFQFTAGFRLPPGVSQLGTVLFDPVDGAPPMAAGLGFTNVPVAPVGPLVDGTNAVVALQAVPPVLTVGAAPKLDFQSGLFLQRLAVANPGNSTQAVVTVRVDGLKPDSQGVPITLQNAQPTGLTNGSPVVAVANLAPGETRGLLAEFYVSDLDTVPTPQYLLDPLTTVVAPSLSTRVLAVDRAQFIRNAAYPDGAVLIEFPTEVGRSYFVQYAPSLADLNAVASSLRTATPSIPGTGSRVQWIDAGPPKTEALPAEGARFYRVILSR